MSASELFGVLPFWLSYPLIPNISLSSLSVSASSHAHAVFSFWPPGGVFLLFQPVPRAVSLCFSCHLCLLPQLYLSFGSPTRTLSVLSALAENAHYRVLTLVNFHLTGFHEWILYSQFYDPWQLFQTFPTFSMFPLFQRMALSPTSGSKFGPPVLNTLNSVSQLCAQNCLLMLDKAGESEGLDSEEFRLSYPLSSQHMASTLLSVAGLPCHLGGYLDWILSFPRYPFHTQGSWCEVHRDVCNGNKHSIIAAPSL